MDTNGDSQVNGIFDSCSQEGRRNIQFFIYKHKKKFYINFYQLESFHHVNYQLLVVYDQRKYRDVKITCLLPSLNFGYIRYTSDKS